VHTGGQLRCGGRFGGGAGAAKVRTAARRPTGGAEDDAEDDEIELLQSVRKPRSSEHNRHIPVTALLHDKWQPRVAGVRP
jgi:hypothetical protein